MTANTETKKGKHSEYQRLKETEVSLKEEGSLRGGEDRGPQEALSQ